MLRGYPQGRNYRLMGMLAVPSAKLSHCDCEHVISVAETISEKQDVGITSRSYREKAELVDADGSAGPF